MVPAEKHEWWQKGIVYQIYPRSFMDSNDDGIGDLPGILGRLDYLQWLGVNAVWLSPIYPSPMADFGYDVSDYCDIHPLFGTLGDFDELLAEIHRRGMHLILDFVPNHTSDVHPWFIESRSSRNSPKRDWYIWRDPAPGGGPPNNWLSNFGGSAWTFDPATGQYFYHAFLDRQPDLNWRNPQVRGAMHDVLRFWLDRGVDGFRVDVIWHIVKDDQFRDNPRNPDYRPGQNPTHEFLAAYSADQPDIHKIIREMRMVIDAYERRMMVGEVYLPIVKLMTYYGEGGEGVHMPFNFQLITLPWNAQQIASAVAAYEQLLPSHGWPNWVLGNHDNPRIASRAGADQARVAAMLLLTLRGTPTMYYGDEIGMHDVAIPPDRVQDPFEKNVPGMGLGRDPQRTPMQWDGAAGAGFTRSGRPWLPIPGDAAQVNVASQREGSDSLLMFHRRLISLRQAEPALSIGSFQLLQEDDHVLLYARQHGDRRLLVALNLTSSRQTIGAANHLAKGRVLLGSIPSREGKLIAAEIALDGNEGVIIEPPAPVT